MKDNLIKYRISMVILNDMLRDELITTQEYNDCDTDLREIYQI
jgi:hypothetical protein